MTTSCLIVAELFARAFTDDLVGIEMVRDSIFHQDNKLFGVGL
jgi:hypothetical protein